MPQYKVLIHFVWTTKNRKPLITSALKPLLLSHIRSNAYSKGIWIDRINCVNDHIHLLIAQGSEQNQSKIVMLIKGESSYWVNKEKLIPDRFEWQTEYFAESVSPYHADGLRKYIENQEEHHRVKSFDEEYQLLLKGARLEKKGLG